MACLVSCQWVIPRPKYEIDIDLVPLNLCLPFTREEHLFYKISDLFYSNERAKLSRCQRRSLLSTWKWPGTHIASRTISTRGKKKRGMVLVDVPTGAWGRDSSRGHLDKDQYHRLTRTIWSLRPKEQSCQQEAVMHQGKTPPHFQAGVPFVYPMSWGRGGESSISDPFINLLPLYQSFWITNAILSTNGQNS